MRRATHNPAQAPAKVAVYAATQASQPQWQQALAMGLIGLSALMAFWMS